MLRSLRGLQDKQGNRIFYLSIPPSIFTDVAACASQAASSKDGWTRVIVEKPFGKDSESFNKLSEELYQHLTEDQMYRIDHYLGKELIENLTVSLLSAPSAILLSIIKPMLKEISIPCYVKSLRDKDTIHGQHSFRMAAPSGFISG